MKITAAHLTTLRLAVEPFDTSDNRAAYIAGNFSRSDKAQDLSMRYRWDLLYASRLYIGDGKGIPGLPLYAYLDDATIDTALRSFIPAFDIGGKDVAVAMARALQVPAAPACLPPRLPGVMHPRVNYFVLEGHTLGYVYQERPQEFNILHGDVLAGGHSWKSGSVYLTSRCELRSATIADFARFRVSPNGHIV